MISSKMSGRLRRHVRWVSCCAAGFIALSGVVAPVASATGVPSVSLIDPLGRPTEPVLQALENAAGSSGTPEQITQAVLAAVGFFRGGDKPGAQLPTDAPPFTQFLWPSIARNCIGGTADAIAPAIAVPGPADLPLPGVDAGHTAFIVTLLGTGPVSPVAAPDTQAPAVSWVNLATGATGRSELHYGGINPEGPATVTTTVNTGPGPVAALIGGGSVTTVIDDDAAAATTAPRTSSCALTPTAALVMVPQPPAAPGGPVLEQDPSIPGSESHLPGGFSS